MNTQKPNQILMLLAAFPWLDIIQTLLAILRITNVITWSWWIVLLPLWIYDVFYIIVTIVGLFIKEQPQQQMPIETVEAMPGTTQELTPELEEMMKQVKEQAMAGAMQPINMENENGNTEDNMGRVSEGSEQSDKSELC